MSYSPATRSPASLPRFNFPAAGGRCTPPTDPSWAEIPISFTRPPFGVARQRFLSVHGRGREHPVRHRCRARVARWMAPAVHGQPADHRRRSGRDQPGNRAHRSALADDDPVRAKPGHRNLRRGQRRSLTGSSRAAWQRPPAYAGLPPWLKMLALLSACSLAWLAGRAGPVCHPSAPGRCRAGLRRPDAREYGFRESWQPGRSRSSCLTMTGSS